jgi:uncharacterized protein YcbK (DUF882 family)
VKRGSGSGTLSTEQIAETFLRLRSGMAEFQRGSLSRRHFLLMGGAASAFMASSMTPASANAPTSAQIIARIAQQAGAKAGPETSGKNAPLKPLTRALSFDNLHTGEKLDIEYCVKGEYVTEALTQINHLMRDHRSGEIHAIDKALLDLLFKLRSKLETKTPIQVVSGYRSPATNAALRGKSDGVARKSLHMEGKAIDLCFDGCELEKIHRAARALKSGGVGYYPVTGFVHIDSGDVRHWAEKPAKA